MWHSVYISSHLAQWWPRDILLPVISLFWLSIYQLLDFWVLSTFWLSWIMLPRTFISKLLGSHSLISLGSIPRSEIAGSSGNTMLNFLRNKLFSKWLGHFVIPSVIYECPRLPTPFPALSVFFIWAILLSVKGDLGVWFAMPWWLTMLSIFHGLQIFSMSSLETRLWKSLAHF